MDIVPHLPSPAKILSRMAVSTVSFGIPMLRTLATEGELIAALTSRLCSEERLVGEPESFFVEVEVGKNFLFELFLHEVKGPPLTPSS